MRKIYSLTVFLCLVLASHSVLAQCNFKGIRTDPNNPFNPELPAKTNTFFNWTNSSWPGNSTCYPGPGVDFTSPFYRLDNLEAIRLLKDNKPEDGWELIKRDFGYRDDGSIITLRPEHTYLILYNKYKGILRVILMTCRKEDYTGAQITVRFQNPTFQTGLLDLSTTAHALDVPAYNTEFTASTTFFNDDSKYFYADYPLAYDPCTCKNQSRLQIISEMIDNATITLSGPVTGNIVTITNKAGSVSNNDGSTGWKKIVSTSEKLVQVHKSIDAFTTQSQKYQDALGNIGLSQPLASFATELKKDNAFQAGLAGLPWIGSAVSLLDLFISGGKKSTAPGPVELMPLSVNLNAKLTGNLHTVVPYHSISFPTPGSLNAQNDVDGYPYYNEVLGVFNLIYTPKVQTKVQIETYTGQDGFRYRLTHVYLRFKPSEIKYVLNPAAEVTIQDMKVALLAEGTGDASGPGGTFDHFEGKDAKTGNDVWSTDYVDAGCMEDYLHELNYGDDPVVNHWTPANIYHLRFILNLRRNNATSTTQNVIYIVKFPLNTLPVTNITYAPAPTNGVNCASSPVIAAQTTAAVQTFCNSGTYIASRYQTVRYPDVSPKEKDLKVKVGVAPNPANNTVNINIAPSNEVLEEIVLLNSTGQTVKQIYNQRINLSVVGFKKTISVQDISNGLYYLNIRTGKNVQATKILIQHK